MISLSWMQIAHPVFQQSVNTIWNTPMLDAKTSYTAHRIREGIVKTDKEIQNLRVALIEKYSKKDENGKTVIENGYVAFETKEANEAFEKEFQEVFSSRTLELKVGKLQFQDLAQVKGISPAQWPHLEPIIEGLPAEETEDEAGIPASPPQNV